jgi:hypothetical protein
MFLSCSTTKSGKESPAESKKTSEENSLTAKGGKLKFDPDKYVTRKYDINKDKKPDIINVFKKIPIKDKRGKFNLQISVKMMDLNRDNKIDVWRYFNDEGAVTKEELDLDFDGNIDATDYYTNGVVRRREIDFQFDEKTDTWKYYDEKGFLIMLEADQSGNGKPDYWEYYKNNIIERIEKDTDNDQKPNIFKKSGDKDFTQILDNTEKFDEKNDVQGKNDTNKPEDKKDQKKTSPENKDSEKESPSTEEKETKKP